MVQVPCKVVAPITTKACGYDFLQSPPAPPPKRNALGTPISWDTAESTQHNLVVGKEGCSVPGKGEWFALLRIMEPLQRRRTIDGVQGLESRLGPHNEAAHVATWGQLHTTRGQSASVGSVHREGT